MTAPAPAPAPARSGVNGALTGRRARPVVENSAYNAFGQRIIRAAGRRIAEGDVDGLPHLVALAGEVERATAHAVHGLREAGYSWGGRSPPGWASPARPRSSAGADPAR